MADHSIVKAHLYGWLLLTPAAILLIAFTHYPTLATLSHSVFSTTFQKTSSSNSS